MFRTFPASFFGRDLQKHAGVFILSESFNKKTKLLRISFFMLPFSLMNRKTFPDAFFFLGFGPNLVLFLLLLHPQSHHHQLFHRQWTSLCRRKSHDPARNVLKIQDSTICNYAHVLFTNTSYPIHSILFQQNKCFL